MLENLNPSAMIKAHAMASEILWDKESIKSYPIIVAGGYLRDMVLKKPIKDIDIFTTTPKFHSAFKMVATRSPSDHEHYNRIVGFKYLCDITHEEFGVKWNFVFFDEDPAFNVKSLITGFDYTNCQIGFDGQGLEITTNFLRDCRDKVLRRVNDTIGNKDVRKQRMTEKFPDWKYVDETEEL